MNYRPFGTTGLVVSELGLGSSALGGGIFYRNDREALQVLHAAFDAGITFYDTAESYGMGRHEELIGTALRGRRDKVVIASKGGLHMSGLGRMLLRLRPLLVPVRGLLRHQRRALGIIRDSQKRYLFDPQCMRRSLEGTLRRLRSDYVDVYQFFNVTESALERDDLFEVMERFREEGKIRCAGVAVLGIAPAFAALRHERLESVQVAISLLDPVPVRHFLPRARERGVAVIGRSPLAGGFLSGAPGHVKATESSFVTPVQLAARRAAAERARFLVRDGRTLAQSALRFALDLEGVATVLFSVADRRMLAENLGALDAPPLTDAERVQIDELVPLPETGG